MPVDLHPSNWHYSKANATDGNHQVGYVEGQNPPNVNRRAALWSGTPESLVLLWPLSDWGYSEALSAAGGEQVGYVDKSFCVNGSTDGGSGCTYLIHAIAWRGTPESRIDLHPVSLAGANDPGDQRSRAVDTDGMNEVGNANFALPVPGGGYISQTHALLWHGTAESVVDLHPANWDASYANGVKNGTQVGYGFVVAGESPTSALVWHGTAESLRIVGEGTIIDTNGSTHVGQVPVGFSSHAFRWDGESGNGFDLHTILPDGYMITLGSQ